MELWRDVPGYEGLYQVSNYGRVRGVERQIIWRKRVKTIKEKLITPLQHPSGHLFVHLCKNGETHAKRIHKLVAEAFIPNPHNFTVVHHIDHNPQNNRVENLMWMSYEEHLMHHKAKTVYQYTLDGVLVAVYESAAEAARQTGYKLSAISRCCNGGFFHKKRNKWINATQHKGFRWSYVPL